jgi:hypothetical protein
LIDYFISFEYPAACCGDGNFPLIVETMETSPLTVETMETSPLTVETMETSPSTVETMKTSPVAVVKITDLYP